MFLKISQQKGKIIFCHIFLYCFLCLIMSNMKSIEEHKVFFLTDMSIECLWNTFFPKHVHHFLIVLILEFSIHRKHFQIVCKGCKYTEHKRNVFMIVFVQTNVCNIGQNVFCFYLSLVTTFIQYLAFLVFSLFLLK